MKKYLFFLLFGFRSLAAQGYQPFDTNMVWRVEITGFSSCSDNCYYYTEGYEINSGRIWHKVYADISHGIGPCSPDQTGHGLFGRYSNDTVAKKVFFVSGSADLPQNFSPNASNVLFDFNINIGDTVILGSGLKYKIISIDSILLGTKYHKIYKGENAITIMNYSPAYAHIVEGIGSSVGIFAKVMDISSSRAYYQLTCFTSTGYSKQVILTKHGIQGYMQTISDTSDCGERILGIASYNSEKSIKVYPNPAIDYITVELPDQSGKATGIKIVNMLGEEQKGAVIEETELTNINISNLPNGLYMVKVYKRTRFIGEKKIAKVQN